MLAADSITLRRHLLDKVLVSDLCEELGLRATVFYRWQKEFFENGAAAFQSTERPHRQVEEKQKRIEFFGEEGADQGRGPGRVDGGAHRVKKKPWGTLTETWVPHDVRDQVVDFVRRAGRRRQRSGPDGSLCGWA